MTKNKTLIKNNIVITKQDKQFFAEIATILHKARETAYKAVNTVMVQANWQIGKRIIEHEQKGKIRADYGEYLIVNLSRYLTDTLGKGFSEANIKNIRQFYLRFPNGIEFARRRLANLEILSWSHWCAIMRIEDDAERDYYITETSEQNWGVKLLERNIRSGYYRRLLSTQKKKSQAVSAVVKTTSKKEKILDFIKDPYILEFLDIPEDIQGKETELETAIINNLQSFMLELGKGFSFIARQFRISTETSHYYIDLVFYNYLLKCFVIIDLKTTSLSPQDVGQMELYVRMFDALKRGADDNPTLGIILCTEKDETVVKYSVLNESKQIFASKYKTILPTEKQLAAMIEKKNIKLLRDNVWLK
ncbi:MAG: PDDEXK nuclease domain-containing protein [Treponema sp.]|nr:PDDEXK nuclease domain-containing protein [Treponema sp.]